MKKQISTVLLALGLLVSCGTEINLENKNRVVYNNEGYYLYYGNTIIELPKDIYLKTEKSLSSYKLNGLMDNESELLNDLERYFPNGVVGVVEGEKPTAYVSIPTIDVDGKKMVDSIGLYNVLANDVEAKPKVEEVEVVTSTNDIEEVKPEGKAIEGAKIVVLNANGKNGYAKTIGEKLKATYNVAYEASNYKSRQNNSYIINNTLNDSAVSELLELTGIKNVKVLEDNTYSDSDAVIILGKNSTIKYNVEIIYENVLDISKNIIEEYKPINKKSSKYKENELELGTAIYYNKEDIYTVKSMAKYITNPKLIEDNTLNNKIVITIK